MAGETALEVLVTWHLMRDRKKLGVPQGLFGSLWSI